MTAGIGALALATASSAQENADSAEVASVVESFHAALQAADTARVLALLAPESAVLESGATETLAEYRAHHLPGDIAFARAVRSERKPVHVRVSGDVAWTMSTSATTGIFQGREIDAAGAESMVLVRSGTSWRIMQIHWSSRTRRR